MQMFMCGVCSDGDRKLKGDLCRLLFHKGDFPPKLCPFDAKCEPDWKKAPQDYMVVKVPSHNTGKPSADAHAEEPHMSAHKIVSENYYEIHDLANKLYREHQDRQSMFAGAQVCTMYDNYEYYVAFAALKLYEEKFLQHTTGQVDYFQLQQSMPCRPVPARKRRAR